MQVRVLFFGILKDLTGRSSDLISLPDHASAADVISHYEQHLSKNKGIFNSIAISVNQEYARPDMKLHAGDEVALLPPVSGGAPDQSTETEPKVFITHQQIDTAGLLGLMKCPEDGAALSLAWSSPEELMSVGRSAIHTWRLPALAWTPAEPVRLHEWLERMTNDGVAP